MIFDSGLLFLGYPVYICNIVVGAMNSQDCRMNNLMHVYNWFRRNRIISSQPGQQVGLGNFFPILYLGLCTPENQFLLQFRLCGLRHCI